MSRLPASNPLRGADVHEAGQRWHHLPVSSKKIQEWSSELDVVTRNIEEATKMFFTEQGMQRAAKRDRMSSKRSTTIRDSGRWPHTP